MVNISIVGAGAISQEAYLPALEEIEQARLQYVVDLDEERAARLATEYGAVGHRANYLDALDETDAVIVATPPGSHADVSRACLESDVHVFTEKPVAVSSEVAAELVELATSRDRHFAISRQYRETPVCQLLTTMLESEALDDLAEFSITFGDETHWGFRSDYRMNRAAAGGGVLTDKGEHPLDVLLWLFGNEWELHRYCDDNYGGLEANASLELAFPAVGVNGTVEITGTRDLSNELVLRGNRSRLRGDPGGKELVLERSDTNEQTTIEATRSVPNSYLVRVGYQAKRFIDAVAGEEPTYVPAASGVEVRRLIETCYEQRQSMVHSWEQPGLERATEVS